MTALPALARGLHRAGRADIASAQLARSPEAVLTLHGIPRPNRVD
ncbi:hypothetical protein AB0I54_45665 [Streptomyces sp. NPDC050625]